MSKLIHAPSLPVRHRPRRGATARRGRRLRINAAPQKEARLEERRIAMADDVQAFGIFEIGICPRRWFPGICGEQGPGDNDSAWDSTDERDMGMAASDSGGEPLRRGGRGRRGGGRAPRRAVIRLYTRERESDTGQIRLRACRPRAPHRPVGYRDTYSSGNIQSRHPCKTHVRNRIVCAPLKYKQLSEPAKHSTQEKDEKPVLAEHESVLETSFMLSPVLSSIRPAPPIIDSVSGVPA